MLSLLPKLLFQELTDISPSFLKEHGIRLLLLDFDNTMLPYTTDKPTQKLLSWLKNIQSAGIQLCVVSNSRKKRISTFCDAYAIAYVTHAAKPATRGIREALIRCAVDKSETALVGDQIFTDVLGANFAGVLSIHVKSIHNHTVWLKLRHLLEVPFLALARNRRVNNEQS